MSDNGGNPMLRVEGVTKTFEGVRALDDVSFVVRERQLF